MSSEDKSMVTLSPQRKQILDFITIFTSERGYAPSVRDLANGCHSSSSSVVQYHLNVLERDGYVHRDRGISRSIRVTRLNNNKATYLGSFFPEMPLNLLNQLFFSTLAAWTFQHFHRLKQSRDFHQLQTGMLPFLLFA